MSPFKNKNKYFFPKSKLINVSFRIPKRIKKRKLGRETEAYSTGTVTGHYLSFVKTTLDMGKFPEMKGHYLIMDNAPIHSSTDIGKYINSRGYRFVYLPPYSPELNPIEQFWSVVKSKVKRNKSCNIILYDLLEAATKLLREKKIKSGCTIDYSR
jgi:transposase